LAANPSSIGNDAKIVAEQEQCYDLRMQGLSIREIARRVGLGVGTVHNRLNDEINKRIAPKSDMLRVFELDKLDDAEARLIAERNVIPVGDNPDAVVKLINSQVSTMARRARLMGLDAPEKVAISGDVEVALHPAVKAALDAAEAESVKQGAEIRARLNGH
jgi:AcrR family transcriptional regulator